MTGQSGDHERDTIQLVFGAGFAFGVLTTLLLTAAVLAATTGDSILSLLDRGVVASIAAAVLFTGIVGTALFVLAFPENRLEIPLANEDVPEEFESGTHD